MPAPEIKHLEFDMEVKSIDESTGEFEGYASTFGNVDLGQDIVMPGAFKKTIRESKGKFPILADHNPCMQIGWNLEASEDEKGLKVRGQLMINDVQCAKERYSLMKKALEIKASAGLSIGYQSMKWEDEIDKTTERRVRKLKEIKLWEYSFVTFPMNQMAMATAAKNYDHWLRSAEVDEAQAVKKFVDKLLEEGFNEMAVKSALVGAAAQINKPEPDLAHLFDQGLKSLKAK